MLLITKEVVPRLSSLGSAELFQEVKDSLDAELFLSDELSDDLTSLLTLQLSIASYRTTEVVRTLTIFSVIFMPITFIAGVYGMNFSNMPCRMIWRF
jgi:magnesium transporter